jgi:hypothetical protein
MVRGPGVREDCPGPVSALVPRPDHTVRSFDPPEKRDVIVVVAAPHDDLVRRFVADLGQRGLPGIPALTGPPLPRPGRRPAP